jgi:hypothetical protein
VHDAVERYAVDGELAALPDAREEAAAIADQP